MDTGRIYVLEVSYNWEGIECTDRSSQPSSAGKVALEPDAKGEGINFRYIMRNGNSYSASYILQLISRNVKERKAIANISPYHPN